MLWLRQAEWWRSTLVAVLPVALAAGIWLLGLTAPLDRQLQDRRFGLDNRQPSGEIVLVDIDSESLAAVGVWPWPRRIHAELLDALMDMGAAEVVFDIDFSARSNTENDDALAAALARAGGYAYLAAFQQRAASGALTINRPLPQFTAEAGQVLVNIDGDAAGVVRSLPWTLSEEALLSLPATLVPTAPPSDRIVIDFGLDLAAIDRIAATDLLNGDVAPERIVNRQVVIGASAIELRDLFQVPRYGTIPGPMVQIAAAETLKAGRNLAPLSAPLQLSLLTLLGLVLVPLRKGMPPVTFALSCLALSAVVEAAAAAAYLHLGQIWPTTACHLLLLCAAGLRLAREYGDRRKAVLAARARVFYLATHDALTGAHSASAFTDLLDTRLRHAPPPVLLLIRLPRLRSINQALGQDLGDALVVEVAERIKQAAGQIPARLATDVFAVVLDGNEDDVATLVHPLAEALDEPYVLDGRDIVLRPTFGAYKPTSEAEESGARMLRRADIALENAQATGRQIGTFDIRDETALQERQELHSALYRAIEQDQFHVVFQPQVDLQSGEVKGAEALVRWVSPELGPISPAAFIPLAEQTGLIVRLGAWVLTEACRQAQATGFSGRLAVNASPMQFQLADMVATVRAALASTGFPADRLDIEVTEGLLVDPDGAAVSQLRQLRELGIGVAIDDFGTGFSSLTYLTHLPFDKLKIDQSFVRGMDRAGNRAVIDMVVALSRRLGKTLVAEGVETAEQAAHLRGIGCDLAQGYYFGRPGPAEALHSGTAKAATPST